MYLTPDLTGANTLYRRDNDLRVIIVDAQKLPFHGPVFDTSLGIVLLGTMNVPLLRDVDWTVQETDIDYTAMSEMRLIDPAFNKRLLKSITFIKPVVADLRINMSYQQLYPIFDKMITYKGQPVEFTPDLLVSMLDDLSYLKQITSPVGDVHSITDTNPWLLEPDPNKERVVNFIPNEEHEIDVPGKKAYIHPVGGSFFKSSLKVRHGVTGQLLTEGSDYKAFGINHTKTAMCNDPSGVYDFILFLRPYVGTMKIDYHAFGGDVSLYDMQAIDQTVNNVIAYLNTAQFLTSQTLAGSDVVLNMLTKMQKLEDQMRQLIAEGRPSYGDVTGLGSALTRKIRTTDTKLHWWTIAQLYKVEGSEEVITADTMKLRVSTLDTKFQFDAVVTVNLNNPNNKMDVQVLSSNYPRGYVPFVDYTELDYITRPQFRIIWNANTVEGSGVLLQIGMPLKKVATEIIGIEDWSGKQSCWKLISPTNTVDGAEDNIIQLPAANHVWDELNVDSRQETCLIPLQEGHLIWAGAFPLNRPYTGAVQFNPNHILEQEVDLTRVRRMRFDLMESDTNKYCQYIDFVPGSDNLFGSVAFTYNGKPASINAQILRDPNSQAISIQITADIQAGLNSNRLDLRHILIYT